MKKVSVRFEQLESRAKTEPSLFETILWSSEAPVAGITPLNSHVCPSTKNSRVLEESFIDVTEKSPGCESRSAVEVAVDECNSSLLNMFIVLNNKALFRRIAVSNKRIVLITVLKSCYQSQIMRDSNTVNYFDKEITTKNRKAWLEL